MNQYEVELSLAETESALVNAASSLVDHERRERYIGERIGYYRTLIRRRKDVIRNLEKTEYTSNVLREEEEECGYRDEEGWNKSLFDKNDRDLEGSSLSHNPRRTQQHDDEHLVVLRSRHMIDEANLKSVVELHKCIIAEIETLRRRVEDLTEKCDDIVKKMDECQRLLYN